MKIMGSTKYYVLQIRPWQWIKNTFILAPLVFARQLFHLPSLGIAAAVFFLFSLLTGVVYIINDILDVEVDRLHPSKRNRPIAAGHISVKGALVFAAALGVISLTGILLIDLKSFWLFLTYLILNILYSVLLKHIIFVDVIVIALGFMLRVLIGALCIDVVISRWLIICSFLLSLFLGLGKRRHELVLMRETGKKKRKVLEKYNLRHLDWSLYLTGVVTSLAYFFYTISPVTVAKFGTWYLAFTIIFICFGIFRYLAILRDRSKTSSPTDSMIRDKLFVGNLGLWVAAVVVVLYIA